MHDRVTWMRAPRKAIRTVAIGDFPELLQLHDTEKLSSMARHGLPIPEVRECRISTNWRERRLNISRGKPKTLGELRWLRSMANPKT